MAAFVTLLCAAALVTACGGLLASGIRGAIGTEWYAAAGSIVAADQLVRVTTVSGNKTKVKSKQLTDHEWVDASLVDQLRAIPGAAGAVGELTFGASVIDEDGTAAPSYGDSLGHGWGSAGLAPFTLAGGNPPQGADEVVVDARIAATAGLDVGDTVRIQTAAGSAPYVVSGITRQRLPHQTTMFFSDAQARILAGHAGKVYAIGIPGPAGKDIAAIRAIAQQAGADVFTGSGRGAIEYPGAGRSSTTLVSLGAVLGGTSLLIAILVVSGTLTLSIGQRQRELALLRALGATPRQVRRMIGYESLILGLAASMIGAGLGIPLAHVLADRFVGLGVIPAALDIYVGPIPLGTAVVGTVLAAWVAARVGARRTATIRPTAALADAAIEMPRLGRARVVLGVIAAGAFGGLVFLIAHLHTDAGALPVSYLAVIVAAVAIALLGPAIGRGGSAMTGVLLRATSRRAGFLAAANNGANPRRLASVITPVALGVAMACAILFPPIAREDAAIAHQAAATFADHIVVASGPGITAAEVAAVRAVPGVQTATQEIHGTVWFGKDKYDATGLTPDGLGDNLDLGVTSGSGTLTNDQVAISRAVADERGLHVGAPVELRLGDGTPITLTVGAIYHDELAFGDVVLSFDHVAAHGDSAYGSALLVRGGHVADLRHAVEGAIVMPPSAYYAAQQDSGGTSQAMGYLILALVVGFISIGIFNTLAMAIGARSRECALLRLVGMKRRGVIGMLRMEASAAALVAVVLGTAIGLAVVCAYARGVTGGGVSIVWWMYGAIIGASAVLVWAASTLAARSALRRDPTEMVAARE